MEASEVFEIAASWLSNEIDNGSFNGDNEQEQLAVDLALRLAVGFLLDCGKQAKKDGEK